MKVSITTVRGYWLRIRSKMGYGSRAELTASAERARGEELRDVITERARVALERAREEQDDAVEYARQQVTEMLASERAAIDAMLKGKLSQDQQRQLKELRSTGDEGLRNDYRASDELLDGAREVADQA